MRGVGTFHPPCNYDTGRKIKFFANYKLEMQICKKKYTEGRAQGISNVNS